MRVIFVLTLVVIGITLNAQDLNTMILKNTFKTDQEVIKNHPDLKRVKVEIDNGFIKILDQNRGLQNQVARSSLMPNLNSFIFSPVGNNFVAYQEAENETEYLYFYQANGTFLGKQKINIYPNVKFSLNGIYVIAFNNFGHQIFVFEANGTLLFSGNYIDLIKDRTKVLDNVFVSEDGKDLLVNAGGKIYSFDMGSKNKKFESEIGGWALASNSSDGILAFKITVPNSEKGTYDFKVLSRSDGKTLDHLSGLKKIDFVKTGVLMSMDSDILEYAFI